MTDWTVPSGAGDLMIRDTGTVVEFWVRSGYSINYNYLYFNYTANGATSAQIQYPLHDTNWHKVASVNVTYSQTVTFRLLTATGTTSLGGPTTISHAISRGTPPPPPDTVTLSSVTANSVIASFTNNGLGTGSFIRWEIGFGTSPTTVQHVVASDGSTLLTGLAAGTTYYFWARGVNSAGTGGWSPRAYKVTLPPKPAPPVVSNVKQGQVDVAYAGAITGATTRQIGYGTNPTTPTTIITTNGGTITGLSAGTTYYFFARGTNASGSGTWSTPKAVTTLSGARVMLGGVWRNAIPYVKVGGVWKVVEPWSRNAGEWKKLG